MLCAASPAHQYHGFEAVVHEVRASYLAAAKADAAAAAAAGEPVPPVEPLSSSTLWTWLNRARTEFNKKNGTKRKRQI